MFRRKNEDEFKCVYAGPEMMEEEDDSKQETEDSKEKDSNETENQEYPKNYQSPSE